MEKENKGKNTIKTSQIHTFTSFTQPLNIQLSKNASHNTKGITLIALVVTIIVLLILAGITIVTLMSDSGVFEKAERAKEETRRARAEEMIGLVNLDAQAQKAINGALTAEEYFEIAKDHGLISDSTIGGDNVKDKGEDEEGNKVYELTTEEGDVFEVTIDEEGNVETEYQGPADGLPPRITEIKTSKTTNSITVEVTVNRLDGGEISYYIKKDSDEKYPDEPEETGKNTSYVFEGLEQNVVYNIKVVVENSKGSDEEEVNERTGELLSGTITQKGETTWSNGEATIELETTETGYTIQYQINSTEGIWQEYTRPITGLHHNDKVFARLWDEVNGSGETAITILDEIAPTAATIDLSSTSTTTGTAITATVTHTDNESGVATANSKYIYNTTSGNLGTTNALWDTATSFTDNPEPLTLSASTPGTYFLHVLTVDNAGNRTEKTSEAVTVTQLVTGISLNQTTATIIEGETLQLTATISPDNASNKVVTWSSNSDAIATVSTSGLVTAVSEGTTTITVRANDGSNVSATCNVTVESAGMSASDIASNPSEYYGKTVSGYTCTNRAAVANWKIFYAGNDFSADGSYHVYLIADDYIPYEYIPKSSGGNSVDVGRNDMPRAAYFTSVLGDYADGLDCITDNNIKKLNNDYFANHSKSTNANIKSIAYMLDTNAWKVYKGNNADYAVGGPSIEMLMKSYSQSHGVDYRASASFVVYGYQLSDNGGSSWVDNIYSLSTSDNLYVITSTSNAFGYWVSSPSVAANLVMTSDSSGLVGGNVCNHTRYGFRPLVCLSSDVKLEQLDNGNFQIK